MYFTASSTTVGSVPIDNTRSVIQQLQLEEKYPKMDIDELNEVKYLTSKTEQEGQSCLMIRWRLHDIGGEDTVYIFDQVNTFELSAHLVINLSERL